MCDWSEALAVELRIDRVGSGLARVELAPHGAEAVVVLAPAKGARAMSRRERGRVVEEEELGKAARL